MKSAYKLKLKVTDQKKNNSSKLKTPQLKYRKLPNSSHTKYSVIKCRTVKLFNTGCIANWKILTFSKGHLRNEKRAYINKFASSMGI